MQTETKPFVSLAKQGDAGAQFNLALLYADGRDLPRDYVKARYWHSKAASQGHAGAQYSLALIHHKGLGTPQDHAKTANWYRMAAEQGHQAAQFNLALLYDEGLGVTHDRVMAYVWFSLAGTKGKNVRTTLLKSTAKIASRLSYSMSKGGLAANGNCDRIALKLDAHELQYAEKLAGEYCARYVLPFR